VRLTRTGAYRGQRRLSAHPARPLEQQRLRGVDRRARAFIEPLADAVEQLGRRGQGAHRGLAAAAKRACAGGRLRVERCEEQHCRCEEERHCPGGIGLSAESPLLFFSIWARLASFRLTWIFGLLVALTPFVARGAMALPCTSWSLIFTEGVKLSTTSEKSKIHGFWVNKKYST
jgi:hypothetical protein